eukprot:5473959-Pleurochrysis_carterae.AAC.3
MHGPYHHLRGDPDPTALVRPSPFMKQTAAAVAHAALPQEVHAAPCGCHAPAPALSRALLGAYSVRGYCHGLFFSLPLSANTRRAINSIATLGPISLVNSVATFHAFFRYFPRVVIESDSLSATFHLADERATDEAAQRDLECLHAMPAFLAAKPRLHVRHVFGAANPTADACSRGRFQELYALCARRLGVHPKRPPAPPD